jgi:DNA invertase Pin-like site-specific DNA recombinase
MIIGYARVSTDGQTLSFIAAESVSTQMRLTR